MYKYLANNMPTVYLLLLGASLVYLTVAENLIASLECNNVQYVIIIMAPSVAGQVEYPPGGFCSKFCFFSCVTYDEKSGKVVAGSCPYCDVTLTNHQHFMVLP